MFSERGGDTGKRELFIVSCYYVFMKLFHSEKIFLIDWDQIGEKMICLVLNTLSFVYYVRSKWEYIQNLPYMPIRKCCQDLGVISHKLLNLQKQMKIL